MKTRLCFTLCSLLALLLSTGCREDMDFTIIESGQEPPVITEGTFSVAGRVSSPDSSFLRDVTVELIGTGLTTFTDRNGYYSFRDAPLPVNGAALSFTSVDFFPEDRYLTPANSGKQWVNIEMKPITVAGSVNGETGGTIQSADQVLLSIPPGAARINGQPYNGLVSAKISYDDPSSLREMQQSAGNFPGRHPSRGEVVLESYGMVYLDLRGEGNQLVTFAEDQPATMYLPTANLFDNELRDSLMLWELVNDRWEFLPFTVGIQEERPGFSVFGSGKLNVDIPFEKTTINGIIVNEEGRPQPGVVYSVLIDNGNFIYTLRTEEDGTFRIPVAANQPLVMQVQDICTGGLDTEVNLGPFAAETDVGNIVIGSSVTVRQTLSGGCGGGEISVLSDRIAYIDGVPTPGALTRNTEGDISVIAGDCDGDGRHYIQLTTEDGREVSELNVRALDDESGMFLIACSQIIGDEYANVSLEGQDTSLTRGSILLLREGDELRQRIALGLLPEGALDVVIDIPFTGTGTFTVEDATFTFTENVLQSGPSREYVCADDCSSLIVEITEGGLGEGFLEGSVQVNMNRLLADGTGNPDENISISTSFRLSY